MHPSQMASWADIEANFQAKKILLNCLPDELREDHRGAQEVDSLLEEDEAVDERLLGAALLHVELEHDRHVGPPDESSCF